MQATADPNSISIHIPTVTRTWAILGALGGVALGLIAATWTVSQMLNQRDREIAELKRESATHVTSEQLTKSIMVLLSHMTIQCDKSGDESTCKTWFSPAAAAQ